LKHFFKGCFVQTTLVEVQRPLPEETAILWNGQEVDEPSSRAVRSLVRRTSGIGSKTLFFVIAVLAE